MTDSAGRILYNRLCENEFIHRRAVCSQHLDEHGASGPHRTLAKVQGTDLLLVSRSGGGRGRFLPFGGVSCISEVGRASWRLPVCRSPHVPDRLRQTGREGPFSGDSFPGGCNYVRRGIFKPGLLPYRGGICHAGIADGKKCGRRRTAGAPFAGGGFFFCGKGGHLPFGVCEKKQGASFSGGSRKRGEANRRDGLSRHGKPPLRAGHEKAGFHRRGGSPAAVVPGGGGGVGRFSPDSLSFHRRGRISEGKASPGNDRPPGGWGGGPLSGRPLSGGPERGEAFRGWKLSADSARRLRRIHGVFKEEEETPWSSE